MYIYIYIYIYTYIHIYMCVYIYMLHMLHFNAVLAIKTSKKCFDRKRQAATSE